MRVVTLNTWKGDGAYRARLAAMGDGLDQLDADVVLLQEVLDAPGLGLHTGAALARRLGLHAAHLPLRDKRRDVEGVRADSRSGLSVLSRHPIRSTLSLPLPSRPDDGDRAILIAELDTPQGAVTVTNLHLTHLDDASLRHRQLAMVQQVARRAGTSLIGGDFNAPAEDLPVNAGPWRDSRQSLGAPARSTLAGRADGPCIDHLLWQTQGRDPRSWQVTLDQIDATGTPMVSDHCAVLVDFGR